MKTFSSSFTSNSGVLRLLVAVSFLNRVVHADFWRYITVIQGGSADGGVCSPPAPSLTIRAGTATVRLFETTQGLTCVPPADGFGFDCIGIGSVTYEIVQPVGDAPALNIVMASPAAAFECSAGLAVTQAYTLGQICPDGTVNTRTKINCSPGSAFRLGDTANFCVASCDATTNPGGVCTQTDLFEITTATTNDGCVFEEATVAPVVAPTGTLAPTSLPSAAPSTNDTEVPEVCGGFSAECFFAEDCCSERCVTNKCQKAIPEAKTKLSEGRGGAGGVAKASGGRRRKLFRSVRGHD
jgi:hypothetical protein